MSAGAAAVAAAAAAAAATTDAKQPLRGGNRRRRPFHHTGFTAYRLRRAFFSAPEAGEQTPGVYDPYAAMYNVMTAEQCANAIAHVLWDFKRSTGASADGTRYLDIGYGPSSTMASLAVHDVVTGQSAALALSDMSYSQYTQLFQRLWHSLSQREYGQGQATATAASWYEQYAKAAGEAIVRKARDMVRAMGGPAEDLDALESLRVQYEDAGGNRSTTEGLNTAMQAVRAIFERPMPPDDMWRSHLRWTTMSSLILDDPWGFTLPDVSTMEFLQQQFLPSSSAVINPTEEQLLKTTLFNPSTLRGLPMLPLKSMFLQPASGLTVLNMTLFHDRRRPLLSMMFQCLCIRLIATVYATAPKSTTAVFFNDFAGRLFPDTRTRGDGGAKSRVIHMVRTIAGPDDVAVIARAFGLQQLEAACKTADGTRDVPIETWSDIRRAVLTRPIPSGTSLFSACVDWMFAASEELHSRVALSQTLQRVEWREAVAVHSNGLQFVRLAPSTFLTQDRGGEMMQKALPLPPVEIKLHDARRFDSNIPGWVIGAVPRPDTFLDSVMWRFHSSSGVAQAMQAGAVAFAKERLVGLNDTAFAYSLLASQPSFRNAVHVWAILNQMTGGADAKYKTAVVVNDWSGTWTAAMTHQVARIKHAWMPSLAADTDERKSLYTAMFPGQTVSDTLVLSADDVGRGSLPIVVNLNWGTRRAAQGKPGSMSEWPELHGVSRALGRMLAQLTDSTAASPLSKLKSVVVCLLLPARKTHTTHTTKDAIGISDTKRVIKDTPTGEEDVTTGEHARSILTEAAMHILALNDLDSKRAAANEPEPTVADKFWIAHTSVTPTLAAMFIKLWPSGKRGTLKSEWAAFKSALLRGHNDAAQQYSWWLPQTQRYDHLYWRNLRRGGGGAK